MNRVFFILFILHLYYAKSQQNQIDLSQVDDSFYKSNTFSLPEKTANKSISYLGEIIKIEHLNQKFLTIKINGINVKLLAIKVPKAKGLSVYFKNIKLANGSKFYIYNQNDTLEYSSKKIYKGEYFSTKFIDGDNIKILLIDNSKNVFQLDELSAIVTQNINKFKKSVDCQIDVNCYDPIIWKSQKRSVVKIIGKNTNQGLATAINCSGVVINSTDYANDKRPYILTADHCFTGQINGIYTSPKKEDLLAYKFIFNYEKSQCNTNDQNQDQYLIGADIIANEGKTGDDGVDFALFRLKDKIPDEFNPYYAGINIANNTSQLSKLNYCIHHPMGEDKKVSITNFIQSSLDPISKTKNSVWRVKWGKGYTKSGSSGSPIFDEQGYLIGILSGGNASNCNDNLSDYFIKMKFIWSYYNDNKKRIDLYIDKNNEIKNNLIKGFDPNGGNGEMDKEGNIHSIKILRNKSSDIIEVVKGNNLDIRAISIWDIKGRLILKKEFDLTFPIQLNYLPNGIYIIKVNIKGSYHTKRLLYLDY